jgi:salicylate hydroxylase
MVSDAIVVGGGIGGLAAATLLARQGVSVRLLEQSPQIAEIGAGVQISPNGLFVLRAMGLEDALRASHAPTAQAVVLNDHHAGRQVARLDLTRLAPGHQYYLMHRADLVELLLDAAQAAGVLVELDVRVVEIVPQVRLQDGGCRQAEVVIAADGLHSVARPALNGADAAFFTGQVAWRALIPNVVDHPPEAHVTMGPGRHLVSYPLRGGELVNLVAVEERQEWAEEGWNHPDDPTCLQTAFASFEGRQAAKMIAAVENVSLWGLHRHPVAKVWTGDRLALLGDAAHPTLPFLAQGANMALEDAWVLADVLIKGGVKALPEYHSRRHRRVSRVIDAANKNAWRYHLRPGPLRTVAHLGLRLGSQFAPGRMLGAFDWLYGYDVTRT